MKYLKVFTDFDSCLTELSEAEIGRLFLAMMNYAKDGTEPVLKGNERFIWGIAKANIDRETEHYNAVCLARSEAGKTGGRPKAKESKQKQKKQLVTKESKKSQDKDKDKEKDNINTNVLINSEFENSLDEFREYRKQIGAKLTPLAEKKLINELDRLSGGNDSVKIRLLDQSIRNGWKGVFPLKDGHGYEEHPAQNYNRLLMDLDAK